MNETQKAMLAKCVVVLPNRIEHEVYEYVLEALALCPDRIVMYCKGDGGDVSSALAIVDLIRQHGNVVGLLPGEANSSHATIFAGCAERYVYPHGFMGVHQIAWDSHNGRLDAQNLRLLAVDFDSSDSQVAGILAAASNKSMDWWYKVIRDTGSGGVTRYSATQMIQLGLARDVGEWKPHPQPLPEFREGSQNGNPAVGGYITNIGPVHVDDGSSRPDIVQRFKETLEKPMVTAEQIEQVKALGYAVIDLNDNPSGAQVRGPNWKIKRYEHTDDYTELIEDVGFQWTATDAWKCAWDHAVCGGLITDNKASQS